MSGTLVHDDSMKPAAPSLSGGIDQVRRIGRADGINPVASITAHATTSSRHRRSYTCQVAWEPPGVATAPPAKARRAARFEGCRRHDADGHRPHTAPQLRRSSVIALCPSVRKRHSIVLQNFRDLGAACRHGACRCALLLPRLTPIVISNANGRSPLPDGTGTSSRPTRCRPAKYPANRPPHDRGDSRCRWQRRR